MNRLIKNKESSVIFFFSLLFVLVFIRSSDSFIQPVVFHFQANRQMFIIGLSLFFGVIAVLNKIKLDIVTSTLLLSVFLGIIPLLYVENFNSYMGNYYPLLIALLAYIITSKSKYDFGDSVKNIISLFVLIISIQILLTELSIFNTISPTNIANAAVKYMMTIPLGGSNLIAAYLLPMIVFLLTYQRSKFSLIVSGISIYALLFTRSKNALILLLIIAFLYIAKRLYGFVLKDEKASSKLKLGSMIFISSILLIVFAYLISIGNTILSGLSFNYTSPINNPFWNYIDTISSGRVRVYSEQLALFSNNLIFGRGFSYTLGQTKSHNWIIDLLVQRGLVGFTVYLISLSVVLKKGLKLYKKDQFVRASMNMLIIILIQGLFEISLFTSGFEFIVWGISGFVVSKHSQYIAVGENLPPYPNLSRRRKIKRYKVVWR